MNEVEKVLFDIVKHIDEHGNYLINNDKPKILFLGYKCTKTNKEWEFKISLLKDFTSPDDFLHKTIRNYVRTLTGRLELIKVLQRIGKLKAFW